MLIKDGNPAFQVKLFQEIIRLTELSWLLARVGILIRQNWLK